MSDESSRSARPYGQRRNDGAPAWWAALDRADLPDNEVVPAAHRRWYEDAAPPAPRTGVSTRTAPSSARRARLITVLAVLAMAVLLATEWVVDPSRQVFIVTLLIGIPAGLAAAVTICAVRRNG